MAVSLACVAVMACGRKLPPLPPIIEVPETTTDLLAYQEDQEIVLSWSYPSLTRAGRQLTDLQRVEIWRLELPPGQEQLASGPQGEELRRQLMLNRGVLAARLEGDGLRAATRGSQLRYAEAVPPIRAGETPSTFWYAVRSRRRDGTSSAISNIVSWQPQVAPAAITNLSARPEADGIRLTWDHLEGLTYVLERQAASARTWDLVAPLTLAEPTFLDRGARQGEAWRYRVRALNKRTAGPFGQESMVDYVDVYPPAPVNSLLCLPEERSIRLRWDPSGEPGVRYKVFRRTLAGTWVHLAEEATATELLDTDPPDEVLEYAVKAMDLHGNQSEAANCTTRTGR